MNYSQWLMNNVANTVGWALVHSVWQGVAVALVLAILLRLMRGVASGVRYGVACAGLGILVLSFGVTLITQLPKEGRPMAIRAIPAAVPVAVPVQGNVLDIPVTHVPVVHTSEWAPERALPWVVAAWLMGVVVLSLWQFGGWMLLRRYRRMAQPAEEAWRARLVNVARVIGVKRVVILVTERLDVPIVLGAFRPSILMPAAVLANLSIPQIEAILAHELAHVRRYDYLVNLIQSAIETLLFYHPAVWWISKQIRREREFCCDEIAASVCGDRATYARALAALEQSRGVRLAPAAGGGGRGELVERVKRQLNPPPTVEQRTGRSRSWVMAALIMVGCLTLGIWSRQLVAQPAPSPTTAPSTSPAQAGTFRWDEFGGGAVVETAGPTQMFHFEIDMGRLINQGLRDNQWMDEQGIDLSFDGGATAVTSKGFAPHRTAVRPVSPDAWEQMSADQVVGLMRGVPPTDGVVPVDWNALPAVFLVRTVDNRFGIIRMRPIVEQDRAGQQGYWVEYRLVTTQPETIPSPQ